MGLKASFQELQKQSSDDLKKQFSKSHLYEKVAGLTNLKKKDHDYVLTAIIYAFTKTSLIDRDFASEERKEVSKRIRRFLNLEDNTILELIELAEKDLKSSLGRNSDFVASFFLFLGKKANEKTRHKIFRYLGQIIASDDDVSAEERYLLELVGEAYGLSDKEVREYLITAEFITTTDDIIPSQEEVPTSNQELPVIKFELD